MGISTSSPYREDEPGELLQTVRPGDLFRTPSEFSKPTLDVYGAPNYNAPKLACPCKQIVLAASIMIQTSKFGNGCWVLCIGPNFVGWIEDWGFRKVEIVQRA